MKATSILILNAILAAMTITSAGAAEWAWGFSAYSDFQDSGTLNVFGVTGSSSDGWDSADKMITPGPVAYAATYHENSVDGWSGATGLYGTDKREPLTAMPGLSKTWTIYVWASPTLGQAAAKIGLGWGYAGWPPPTEPSIHLTLMAKPTGITGGPAVGTTWDLNVQQGGEVEMPVYRSTDGRTGYVFDLTATVIPEPSSLAALGLALAGVGIGAMRKRK